MTLAIAIFFLNIFQWPGIFALNPRVWPLAADDYAFLTSASDLLSLDLLRVCKSLNA